MGSDGAVPFYDQQTLHLPRILCLHGGGTNARIFRAQCRVLEHALRNEFRLCFAEGPFPSVPGPDVTSVYEDFGPFKAWLQTPPGSEDPPESGTAAAQVQAALRSAMVEDDDKGATGEWVALLGFSQGAKVSASLLFAQQQQQQQQGMSCVNLGKGRAAPRFRFGVLMAGRGPLVPELVAPRWDSSVGTQEQGARPCWRDEPRGDRDRDLLLRVPAIHVHGLADPGLALHRNLLSQYCDGRWARLVEWDGTHRLPIKSKDVTRVVQEILSMAEDVE